jgi:hypothetical protein
VFFTLFFATTFLFAERNGYSLSAGYRYTAGTFTAKNTSSYEQNSIRLANQIIPIGVSWNTCNSANTGFLFDLEFQVLPLACDDAGTGEPFTVDNRFAAKATIGYALYFALTDFLQTRITPTLSVHYSAGLTDTLIYGQVEPYIGLRAELLFFIDPAANKTSRGTYLDCGTDLELGLFGFPDFSVMPRLGFGYLY